MNNFISLFSYFITNIITVDLFMYFLAALVFFAIVLCILRLIYF